MNKKPPRCPKCGGVLMRDHDAYYCVNCGSTIDPTKVKKIRR